MSPRAFGVLAWVVVTVWACSLAALPVIAGVAVTTFVPVVGDLREGVGWLSALHTLWIAPLFYGAIRVIETFFGSAPWSPRLRELATDLTMVLVLAGLLGVFFAHPLGQVLAALASVGAFWCLKRLLDRAGDPEDDDPDQPSASSSQTGP
jgi:hypothetical protein